jgi:predicted signal transduction protein with EAL and GGDEF domain
LLLREVGHRLALTVRESDTVARLGGDEFVVILGEIGEPAAAAEVARKILDSVGTIDRIAEHEINVSFSIGVAIYPDDAPNVTELVMRADLAMYQAKESGRNMHVFFDPEMDRASQRRNQLRLRLSKALQLDQFALLYQPKVDLDSGRVVGAEALIRWIPEAGQVVSPADFIPLAEEIGLILPIGAGPTRGWRRFRFPSMSR